MKPSFRWLFLAVFSLLFLESAFAHYDPRIGRWLSRDPIGEAGGLNLYAYCGNDPVNRHDPLGLVEASGPAIVENLKLLGRGIRGAISWLSNFTKGPEGLQNVAGLIAPYGSDPFSTPEERVEGLKQAVTTPEGWGRTLTGGFLMGRFIPFPGEPLYVRTGGLDPVIGTRPPVISPANWEVLPPSKSPVPISRPPVIIDVFPDGNGVYSMRSGGGAGAPSLPGPLRPVVQLPEGTLGSRIASNYQRYYNDGWLQAVREFNNGQRVIPKGIAWQTVLGQRVDSIARGRLLIYLQKRGIAEGPGESVLVNRWLRDPSDPSSYRIPDVRITGDHMILDGTIAEKMMTSEQVLDFILYSGGDEVILVKPQVGPMFGQ